jgi:N6-L-threonylcarbamoyladenine synthase
MIALAAGMRLQAGLGSLQPGYTFDVKPRWPLGELQAALATA